MTIERLFEMNGHHGGFWVQHRTWQNLCARIEGLAARSADARRDNRATGVVPLPSLAATVVASGYDVRSGRRLKLGEWPEDSHYVQIAKPPWHRDGFAVPVTTAERPA